MFASLFFPQTEIPPFEDVQKTLKVIENPAFILPVRAFQY